MVVLVLKRRSPWCALLTLTLGCSDYELQSRCERVAIEEHMLNGQTVEDNQSVSTLAGVPVEGDNVLVVFASHADPTEPLGLARLTGNGSPDRETCGFEGVNMLQAGTGDEGTVFQPVAVFQPEDQFVAVVYNVGSESGELSRIQFRYVEPSGCDGSPPLTLAEAADGVTLLPARAAALRANLHLAVWPTWGTQGIAPLQARLVEQRLQQPQALFEAPTTLLRDGRASEVALAALPFERRIGALVAVKHQRTSDHVNQILLLSIEQDLSVTTELSLAELGDELSSGLSVALDGDRGIVLWSTSGRDASVMAQRFEWEPVLRRIGDPIVVAGNIDEVNDVSVIRLPSGDFLAAWSEVRNGSEGRAYWQPLDSSGRKIAARMLTSDSCGMGPIELPLAGANAPIRRGSLTSVGRDVQYVYEKEIRGVCCDSSGTSVWGFRVDSAEILPL